MYEQRGTMVAAEIPPRRCVYPFREMKVGGKAYKEVLIGKKKQAIYSAIRKARLWVAKHRKEDWRFHSDFQERDDDGNIVVMVWRIK